MLAAQGTGYIDDGVVCHDAEDGLITNLLPNNEESLESFVVFLDGFWKDDSWVKEFGETEIKKNGRIFLVCEEEGATKLKSFAGW